MNACPEAVAQYPNVEVWWTVLHMENSFGLGGWARRPPLQAHTWLLALLLQAKQSWSGAQNSDSFPVGTSFDNYPDFCLRCYQV